MKNSTFKTRLSYAFGTALSLSLLATAASAETVTMSKEGAGYSLHDGNIHMVLYYMENDASHTVVATYAAKDDPTVANRFKVSLNDQARVHYFLPGEQNIFYSFERSGDAITVTTQTQSQRQASLH